MAREATPHTQYYLRAMSAADQTKLAVMANDLKYLVTKVDGMDGKMERDYITRTEHQGDLAIIQSDLSLLKKIVFGFIGTVLTALILAWMSGLLAHPSL